MKVVVTGGAGFIGANVCRVLAAHDDVDEVVVIDDLSTGSESNLEGLPVELVKGSILDAAVLDATISGAHSVIHLGARPSVPRSIADPMASHQANATGTLEVLEAVRRAGAHVVVASSSSIYGANETLPKTEDLAPLPKSPYAASKLATEAYALSYTHSFDVPVLAFRFFNVYGPLQPADHAYAAVVPAFVSAALAGKPLVVHGDGRQSRDFTFVDTVAAVLVAAATGRVQSTEPVNLAYGTRTDLLSLIELLGALLGRELEVEHTDPRPGDARHSQADSSRLQGLFPQVEPVGLEDGLRATIDWFESLR